MYLFDTNTLIYFFKGQGNIPNNVLARSPKEITIPAIVLFELEVGVAKSQSPQKRIKQLQEFISLIQIIPFGGREAKTAAIIRAKLDKKGTPIGSYDTLIASTAVTHEVILITRNTTEFARIKKLKIENWY